MPDAQPTPQQESMITNAAQGDQYKIDQFLDQIHKIHRHLDWFSPISWIGQQPFLLESSQQQIDAILLAAPEVPLATWVRLFAARDFGSIDETWQRLLIKAMAIIETMEISTIASLGTSNWFINLLRGSNFTHSNSIVVLEKKITPETVHISTPDVKVRPMHTADLDEVAHVDHAAFVPIWQNSLASLKMAFHQSGIATVAVKNQQIVGYQISTLIGGQVHLARLAVRPDQQGHQIASSLVSDLIIRCMGEKIERVTVNTQDENAPSLAVYKKFGFQRTGEQIPVWIRVL